MDKETQSDADSPESAASPDQGLVEEAQALIADYRALAGGHLRLAALEAREAGESLIKMIITGIVTGGFLVLAWVSLMAALTFAVVEQGWLPASLTLLFIGVAHLVLVLVGIALVRRQGRGLLFSALVRDLDPRKSTASQPGSKE
ncbi:phage holin family protein [Aliidiomarina sp. Khilg15.8]